jgi:hypothetical protein
LEKFGRRFELGKEVKTLSLIRIIRGELTSHHLDHLGKTKNPKINLDIPQEINFGVAKGKDTGW